MVTKDKPIKPVDASPGPLQLVARALLLSLTIAVTIWVESSVLQRVSSSSMDALGVVLQDQVLGPRPDLTSSAVVLYDEDFLKDLDSDWPPGFDALRTVATELWCQGATTVVFDFTLTKVWRLQSSDRGDAEKRFVDLLHGLGGTTPSDEAVRRGLSIYCRGDRPRSSMRAFVAPPQDDRWPEGSSDLVVGVGVDGERYYPRENVRSDKSSIQTAAFRAFDILCASQKAEKRKPALGCEAASQPGLLQRDSWVTPVDQQRFSLPGFNAAKPTCIGRGLVESARAILRLAWDGAQRNWRTCPPVLTFLPGTLVDQALPSDWLAGRAVFVGARIGDSDLVETPFHHGLPGVYVHALALEQLLSGRSASRVPAELEQFLVVLVTVFLTQSIKIGLLLSLKSKVSSGSTSAWLGVTLGLIAVGLVLLLAAEFDWPSGFRIRYALLMLIGLGFPSLDPIELLAGLSQEMRTLSEEDFKAALLTADGKSADKEERRA